MYITYSVPARCRQITFEEILMGVSNVNQLKAYDRSATRTIKTDRLPEKLRTFTNVEEMVEQLKQFNDLNADLRNEERHSHYRTFQIPKKTGGLREINAPDDTLKTALSALQIILRNMMLADHHTGAYAYVTGRSTIDAVKKHQSADNHWFVKFDFHGFFPSTTTDFILSQFKMIYPFSLIMMRAEGEDEMRKALDLCMLDGGLPQGTPISPFITNVMMIPFDHEVMNALHEFDMGGGKKERFTYTRYADDICVSCHVTFEWRKIQEFIVNKLHEMNAPFYLNEAKTHYGSRSGRNWILGVMLNKDNDITLGYRAMKTLKATIMNYLMDKKNGKSWSLEDVQTFSGNLSYFRMVEADTVNAIVKKYNEKTGMDLMECIKADLS